MLNHYDGNPGVKVLRKCTENDMYLVVCVCVLRVHGDRKKSAAVHIFRIKREYRQVLGKLAERAVLIGNIIKNDPQDFLPASICCWKGRESAG